jgi:Helix-loop-helix DNA-binding domain
MFRCKVVRVGSSVVDVEARVPSLVTHRHRDYHRHVLDDCSTRSGLPVTVEQRLRQSMIDAVSDEQQTPPLPCERKIRREIANHNERKRMQSINAGFQSLRTLLPRNGGSSTSSSSADRLSKVRFVCASLISIT